MSNKYDGHWARTKSLTTITLVIWAFFGFAVNWFGDLLNSSSFPGAYYMAGQGSQIAFALLVFWFASRQNKIDEEFGFQEDEEK